MAISILGTTVVDDSRNAVAFGNLGASGIVAFTGTSHMRVPAGTTAERPGSPAGAEMRYNSQTNELEFYTSSWQTISFGGITSGSIVSTDFSGLVTLEIQNSAGTALKTIYSPGS